MGDFQSSPERLRIEDFQSFEEGFGFLDFLDWIEAFFQPLELTEIMNFQLPLVVGGQPGLWTKMSTST